MSLPEAIHIREVSPRDGLQSESTILTTKEKLRLVDLLVEARLRHINVTSFVSPRRVPQLADASELCAKLGYFSGVTFDASVANPRGVERAVESGIDVVSAFVSWNDEASMANVGKCAADAMEEVERLITIARDEKLVVIGTIGNAFGTEGSMGGGGEDHRAIKRVAEWFVNCGASCVALGDTTGVATPGIVRSALDCVRSAVPSVAISVHFHDTRGFALANAYAAMEMGVTSIDAAVGGIGGSPFARLSGGNLATEELVRLCDSLGVDTGVDFDQVVEAHRYLRVALGHELFSKLGRICGGKK